MVKLTVNDNKLWLQIAKRSYQLESATIYKHPTFYEIVVIILDGQRKIRQTFKQKTFAGLHTVIFIEVPFINPKTDEFTKKSYASGSKESPTAINWYVNYYECKE